MKNKVILLYL